MPYNEAALRGVCKQYNMIDAEMVVKECKTNPGKECAKLKEVCHDALRQGKANIQAGKNDQANSNFALAYQARCMCDYIWSNVMNKEGDRGHAEFLQKSRDFSKFALEGLQGQAAKDVEKMIKSIH
jgi:hypothetical protein